MAEKYIFTVTEEEAKFPLKRIIKRRFSFSSRFMTKIKYQNLIKLNDETVPGWVIPKEGDIVSVSLPKEESHFEPEDIPVSVLFEDDDLLFINKQPGITVHPTKGHPSHTMANALMKYEEDTSQDFKIRFVNRLDMDTSGVLLVAKNSHAQADLNRQMAEGDTCKEYYAFCSGVIPEDELTIEAPIGSPFPGSKSRTVTPDGHPSITKVTVLKRFLPLQDEKNHLAGAHTFDAEGASLLKIRLLTGRTHQIRVHLSYIGHPLLGDELYGGDTEIFPRQALHAFSFSCIHPITKERLTVESPLPNDLTELASRLEDRSSSAAEASF